MISEKANDETVKRFPDMERVRRNLISAEHRIVDLENQIKINREIIHSLCVEKEVNRQTINSLQTKVKHLEMELKIQNRD